MRFTEVIGQNEAKERLVQMVIENRLPHALMLCGPQGSGKMALALAFASYLLCPNRKGEAGMFGPAETAKDSCGSCQSCTMLRKWAHPDLHFTFPVIKLPSMNAAYKPVSDDFIAEWHAMLERGPYFSLEEWLSEMDAENQQAIITVGESNELIRKLSLKASQGGYKVSLIWLPERMNTECANKLLKLLEEPPQETVFIMVCEEPEKLLETIRSRVQRIDIRKISTEAIEHALVQQRGLDAETAKALARIANGNWLKALEMLDSDNENRLFLDRFIALMRLCYKRDINELKRWSEQMAAYGRERQLRFLNYSQRMIRESFMHNFQTPELCYMTIEEAQFAKNFARFINEANVISINDLLDRCQRDIAQNANAKIVFFDMVLKMIVLLIQK